MLENYSAQRLSEEKVLLTNPIGDWAIIGDKQYEILESGRLEESPELHKLLRAKFLVIDDTNEREMRQRIARRYDFISQDVQHFILSVSGRCNCRCEYCCAMAGSKGDTSCIDMDESTAKKAIDFAFQSQSRRLTIEFQGGETLLNFKTIKQMVEYANEKNKGDRKELSFAIATNLLEMDDDILSFLFDHKVIISTSLDGPKFLHDKNRVRSDGEKENYDKVVYWIRKIREKYGYPPNASLTVTRDSLPYWKEIIDEYRKLGLSRILIRYMHFIGSAKKEWRRIGYTADEFFEFWKSSLEYIFELNLRKEKFVDGVTIIELQKIYDFPSGFSCNMRPCGSVLRLISIDSKGDIFICDAARSDKNAILGNISSTTYKEIRDKHLLGHASEFLPHADECVMCPWLGLCTSCATSNLGMFGDIHLTGTKGNMFCEINKLKLEYLFKTIAEDGLYAKVIERWTENFVKR